MSLRHEQNGRETDIELSVLVFMGRFTVATMEKYCRQSSKEIPEILELIPEIMLSLNAVFKVENMSHTTETSDFYNNTILVGSPLHQ